MSIPKIAALLLGAAVAGCATGSQPSNQPGSAWMPTQSAGHLRGTPALEQAMQPPLCSVASVPAGLNAAAETMVAGLSGGADPIAPGDRLRLRLAGDTDRMSGVYVVASDGTIAIPGITPFAAAGLGEADLRRQLGATLVAAELVRALPAPLDLRLIESAGVSVAVSGAVFEPGTVRAGERAADNRIGQREGQSSGDANAGRTVATALRAAGGVRPDADVTRVYLLRGRHWARIDLSGVASGNAAAGAEVALASGDRLIVPSDGCFHAELVRPTAITQPGIRVYMSNLSRPANNNAGAAIGKDATSLPYGTRMLQALVAMNCVGGSAMNRDRRAVLISRNPANGQSIVIQRAVERLVRDNGRDGVDPHLMPGDSLACYDSQMMAISDVIGLAGSAFNAAAPALLLRNAIK